MAIRFLEPGTDATLNLNLFGGSSTAGGTVSSATDQFHTGTSSLKVVRTSGALQAYAQAPNGLIAGAGDIISAYIRFSTVAPDNAIPFIMGMNGGGGIDFGVGINTNGTLRCDADGATGVNGSTTLSQDTWYRISISWFITNSTTYTFKVYLNGTLEITMSNAGTLTDTNPVFATFGMATVAGIAAWTTAPTTLTIWFDDLYIDNRTNASDCGDIRVTNKRAFSNGSANEFVTQIGSGGSGYGTGHAPQVNEQPASATNGWSIVNAGSVWTEEYNIEGLSVGDVDLTGATLVDYMGWCSANAAISETAQMVVNNVTSNISLTSATTRFRAVAGSTTYPAGSGTDIGIVSSTTVTTVRLFECGIVFAYLAAGGGPSTIIHNIPTMRVSSLMM